MKKKICILAFDDGPHQKDDLTREKSKHTQFVLTPLVGVVCKGRQLLHVTRTYIDVDGFDSTLKILEVFCNNPFREEIRLIMIDSPTLGGFNIPNANQIYKETGCPVVLLPDRTPKESMAEVYASVFPDRVEQLKWLRDLPPMESLEVSLECDDNISREIFFHAIGTSKSELAPLLQFLAEYSAIPEPLRLAHIIASTTETD